MSMMMRRGMMVPKAPGGIDLGTWEQGAINGSNTSSNVGKSYARLKTTSTTRIRTVDLVDVDPAKTYHIMCDWTNYNIVVQPYDASGLSISTVGGLYPFGEWLTQAETFSGVPKIAIAVRKSSQADITPSEIDNVGLKIY